MPFQVTWEQRANTLGLDDRVAVLADGRNRLEVWPAFGFNAHRWQVAGHEYLYRTPQFFDEAKPTRGGFPILFPFPNRIRDGRFTWENKNYQLAANDPAAKNAIHGFTPYRPWRVVDHGANANSAWITAEFQGSRDAPDSLALWPADYRLRLTYRLFDHVLRVEADADNPDTRSLPFGLGYHPYFPLAPFGGAQALVTVAASKAWELKDNLPTGKRLDVEPARDLRNGQPLGAMHLDEVMTDLFTVVHDPDENLGLVALLQHPSSERMLTMWLDADFREMVVFTPPHREAICLEPYTCTTDALNLAARGIDGGLRVLQPGERWHGVIEMHLANADA